MVIDDPGGPSGDQTQWTSILFSGVLNGAWKSQ